MINPAHKLATIGYALSSVLIVSVGLSAVSLAEPGAPIYRWTDEKGNVVFSDKPPPLDKPAEEIELEVSKPSEEEVEAAERRMQRWIEQSGRAGEARDLRRETQKETSKKKTLKEIIPPKPELGKSEFFKTVDWRLTYTFRRGQYEARYNIKLLPLRSLPSRAHLELEFQDPANPQNPAIIDHPLHRQSRNEFQISSPLMSGWRCGTYWVTINLYEDATKSKLLGQHEQQVRSVIDSRIVTSRTELARRLMDQGHSCSP